MPPRKSLKTENEEVKVPDWAKSVEPETKPEKEPEKIDKSEVLNSIYSDARKPVVKKSELSSVLKRDIFLKVSLEDQILFARHLSLMSKAGMSLLDSIQLLKKQARSKSMAKILENVAVGISNGQFLSVALEPYKYLFGELFINIVRIGETSGTLPENLVYLAEELDKKRVLRSKVKGAMVYPAIIVIGVVAIVSFLVFFLFPKIIPVFASLNVKLPLPTRILIAFANLAREYTIWVILGVLGVGLTSWLLLKIRAVRKAYHRTLLALPIFGNLFQAVNMASFCRTLGILLKSGSKIVESLGTTANTLDNLVYRDQLLDAAETVRKGGQLSGHLMKSPRIFPLMLAQMVSVGESTANLVEVLNYLAGFYEEEIDNTTKNLSTILEPALLIILGAIVGFVAIAVITPIYGITQGVR